MNTSSNFLKVTLVAGILSACIPASLESDLQAQNFELNGNSNDPATAFEGYTEPYRDIHVGASDTGTVAEIRVDEGQRVRFGQVLARLDDAVVRTSLAIASEAAASSGERDAAQLQVTTSQRKYEQTLTLHGRNHATDQELWQSKATLDESLARLRVYQELSVRRKLELAQAEAYLQRMTIRSPIDGMVIEKCKDVGETVSPADPHLLRIVQLDPLRITATASVAQSRALLVGQELLATTTDRQMGAIVEFISPVVDAGSGTVIVHLRLPNPDGLIAGGVVCRLSIVPSAQAAQPVNADNSLNVPRQTLLQFPFRQKSQR